MIDLGYEIDYGPETEETKKAYPSFHVNADGAVKLPGKVGDEFVVKVKLKKVSGEMRETEGGEKKTSCTYEVREMEAPSEKPKSFSETIDEIAGDY